MNPFFRKILNNIEWFFTSLFIILIPFVYIEEQADPVLYSRYMFLSIWLLLLSIIFIIKIKNDSFSIILSRTDKIFFSLASLFILANILSMVSGVHNLSEAIFKTVKEFSLLLMLFYFHQMLRNKPSGIDILIKSIIIMTAGFQAIGLYQLSQVDFSIYLNATEDFGYYLRQDTLAVKSTLANINIFVYFLVLSLNFSIYASIIYKSIWRVFSILVTTISIAFILFLASKGGWLSLSIFSFLNILILYFYLFFKYTKETGKKIAIWKKMSLILLPILIFLFASIIITKNNFHITQLVKDKFEHLIKLETDSHGIKRQTTVKKRILLWESSLKIIKESPVLGIGAGQWRIEYAKYGLADYGEEIQSGHTHYQRPHNDLLWIMSETGSLGLFFFLLMYLSILIITLINMLDKKKSNKARLFNLLALSTLIVFILVLSISYTRERITHNLVFLLIMAIVLFYKEEKLSERFRINKKIGMGILTVFIMISIFNIIIAKDMVNGEAVSQTIRIGKSQNNYSKINRALNSIEGSFYTMDGFSAPLSQYKGLILTRHSNMKGAKKEFLKAHLLHPYHLLVLIDLATIYNVLDQKDSSLFFYNKALEISPHQKRALVSSAILYYNKNMYTKAMKNLKKVSFKGEYPKNLKAIIIAVSQEIAKKNSVSLNPNKYKKWRVHKTSAISTFIEYQKGEDEFSVVLIKELGD